MHVEVISEPAKLRDFAPEWDAFLRTQPNVTPFQTPEWLLTWWSHFGSGLLRVYVFRDPDCVGVVPCFVHQWNGARQVTLVGSGISDFLDPLLTPRLEDEIIEEMGRQLQSFTEWDICSWQDLARDTRLSAIGRAFRLERYQDTICSEAELMPDFETYWRQRPHHLLRNVRRYGDKARSKYELSFCISAESNADLLETLFKLHAAQWKAKGEAGMLEANGSGHFLADISGKFAERDMLRIFSLSCDCRVVASMLAFVYNGKIFGYLTGSDPAYHWYRVASLLLSEALRYACMHGFRAWNFCRGDEPYKSDWGGRPIPRCRLLIHNSV